MFLKVGDVFKAGSTTLARERSQGRVLAQVTLQRTPVGIATVTELADKWLWAVKVLLLGVFTQARCTHERLVAVLTGEAPFLAAGVMDWQVLWQVRCIRESLVTDRTVMWLLILMVDFHMLPQQHQQTETPWWHAWLLLQTSSSL